MSELKIPAKIETLLKEYGNLHQKADKAESRLKSATSVLIPLLRSSCLAVDIMTFCQYRTQIVNACMSEHDTKLMADTEKNKPNKDRQSCWRRNTRYWERLRDELFPPTDSVPEPQETKQPKKKPRKTGLSEEAEEDNNADDDEDVVGMPEHLCSACHDEMVVGFKRNYKCRNHFLCSECCLSWRNKARSKRWRDCCPICRLPPIYN